MTSRSPELRPCAGDAVLGWLRALGASRRVLFHQLERNTVPRSRPCAKAKAKPARKEDRIEAPSWLTPGNLARLC